ncbi:DUF6221 family protein [Streptomyces bobili]|uniref:DUF6221 family protein n=1 Tax=Streptomyces bobili TaxID=67280 RepID=UPI00342F89B4
MADFVQWLRAQLDVDAARAIAAPRGPWSMDGSGSIVDADGGRVIPSVGGALDGRSTRWPEGPVVDHVIAWDPAQVLRDIEGKRRIVDRYSWLREHGDTGGIAGVLQLLALPYADRPGFREEWRP